MFSGAAIKEVEFMDDNNTLFAAIYIRFIGPAGSLCCHGWRGTRLLDDVHTVYINLQGRRIYAASRMFVAQ